VEASSPGRSDILDAAEELMAGKGIDSTSIADICRKSGLPVGSIYWHFGSKSGLVAAVMDRGAERFFAQLPSVDQFTGSPFERLRQWFDDNTRQVGSGPDFLRLHLSLCLLDAPDPDVKEIILRVRDRAAVRLSGAWMPWLSELGVPDAETRAREFGELMLATVDGAFVAQQLGVTRVEHIMSAFFETASARAQELAVSR
jgi:AcrR family transcriptional regulator